jgi:2'-5' RNA ligase
VLCLPVTGLDAVAASVVEATADVGEAPEDRPFFGHLTLARARRGAHPAALRRLPPVHVSGAWPVTEVTVVASRTGGSGSRYEVVERVPV